MLADLDLLRRLLEDERASLLSEGMDVGDERAPVKLDQQSVGRLSRMDAMARQAMAQAVGRRRNARLIRIEAALARIAAGDYGDCEDCGEAISPGRLRLDPTVTLCIDCARG